MNNLLRAEMYKLKRNKTFWALLISILGISTLLHYLIVIDWWMITGTPFEQVGLDEFNALATFIVPIFFNLIVSTLVGFFIATEFSQQSVIKTQVISGHKRSHIYLAKYVVVTFGALIVTIVIPLVSAIVISLLFGKVDILTMSNVAYLGKSYGLFTLQFLSFTAIVLIFAIVTEDSGRTIIFTLVLAIIMFILEKYVTNSFVQTLYEYTFFNQINVAFHNTMTSGEIAKSLIIGLIWLIVMLTLGVFIFKRKEIK